MPSTYSRLNPLYLASETVTSQMTQEEMKEKISLLEEEVEKYELRREQRGLVGKMVAKVNPLEYVSWLKKYELHGYKRLYAERFKE